MTTKQATALPTITQTFHGAPITFREDGWVNLTHAARNYKKDLSNFWRTPGTMQYIEALSEIREMHGISLISIRRGRGGGTWVHPKLAVVAARWLDVRFAVWCDLMIDNILRGNITTTVAVPTLEAQQIKAEFDQAMSVILALKKENQDLKEQGFQGELPPGWATCGVFLEDKGVSFRGVQAHGKELGFIAATEMARRGLAAATLKSKRGTLDKDKAYYPPEVLEHSYRKLKDQQLGLFASQLP